MINKKYINSLYINPGGNHEDNPCPGKLIAITGIFFIIKGAMLSNDAALSCQPCIAKIGCLSCEPHNLPATLPQGTGISISLTSCLWFTVQHFR